MDYKPTKEDWDTFLEWSRLLHINGVSQVTKKKASELAKAITVYGYGKPKIEEQFITRIAEFTLITGDKKVPVWLVFERKVQRAR